MLSSGQGSCVLEVVHTQSVHAFESVESAPYRSGSAKSSVSSSGICVQ